MTAKFDFTAYEIETSRNGQREVISFNADSIAEAVDRYCRISATCKYEMVNLWRAGDRKGYAMRSFELPVSCIRQDD